MQVGHDYPLSRLCVNHLQGGYKKIPTKNCQLKEIPFSPITDVYFNQEPIRLQHGFLKTLNFFFSPSFNIAFWGEHYVEVYIITRVLWFFLLFRCKMERNIKSKVQTNSMIAIHQGGSTVMIHPLKMCWFIQDLGLAKRMSYIAKTRENTNWWDFLSTRKIVCWSSTGSSEQSHRR